MLRFLDLIISCVLIVAFAPLMLMLILLLRATAEGEVFFRQNRIGVGGTPFALLKYATMLKDSPNLGSGTITLKDDPRVLPVGRYLRALKIDELPQLYNVLKGEMSLVGPRPQTRRCFDTFSPLDQSIITQARPGLTGIGSLVFRNEENLLDPGKDPVHLYKYVIMPYKAELEHWYIRNQGLRTYLLCILATGWTAVFNKSSIVWYFFPGLPSPPDALASSVNWPGVKHYEGASEGSSS